MSDPDVRIVAHEYGDSGALFHLAGDDYEARWSASQAIGAGLRKAPPRGFEDVVASFQSVFVAFDPHETSHAAITQAVLELAGHMPQAQEPRTFEVDVVYGGEMGPDLEAVAQACGLATAEVIDSHTSALWTVRFAASPAGAPFMDGSLLPVSVPRLTTPRPKVVPGSVALSGRQCAIYTTPSPGGWQLIGRTPMVLFDVMTPPYLAYRPGDRIRYVPIALADFEAHRTPPRQVRG